MSWKTPGPQGAACTYCGEYLTMRTNRQTQKAKGHIEECRETYEQSCDGHVHSLWEPCRNGLTKLEYAAQLDQRDRDAENSRGV